MLVMFTTGATSSRFIKSSYDFIRAAIESPAPFGNAPFDLAPFGCAQDKQDRQDKRVDAPGSARGTSEPAFLCAL